MTSGCYSAAELTYTTPRVCSKVSMRDASILDAVPPSTWTPENENGSKVPASARVTRSLHSLVPLAHHPINFLLDDSDLSE